jgi:hypothetical protein
MKTTRWVVLSIHLIRWSSAIYGHPSFVWNMHIIVF